MYHSLEFAIAGIIAASAAIVLPAAGTVCASPATRHMVQTTNAAPSAPAGKLSDHQAPRHAYAAPRPSEAPCRVMICGPWTELQTSTSHVQYCEWYPSCR
jgi:hypothetical protein